MTAAVQTRCPSWCTEDRPFGTDGRSVFHTHRVGTALPGMWAEVIDEPPFPNYIDIEVTRGHMWTPDQVVDLIGALVKAIWIYDPDFEHPTDTDPSGLWQAVGATVRDHTSAAGLDQTTLAMLLNITQPDFSIISRGVGVRTFTLTELAAIAEILGLTLTDLVSDIEARR